MSDTMTTDAKCVVSEAAAIVSGTGSNEEEYRTGITQSKEKKGNDENDNMNDLIDSIHGFLKAKDGNKEISKWIAKILNNDHVSLAEMAQDYNDNDLNAYVDSWDVKIPIRAAFKAAIKKMRKNEFSDMNEMKEQLSTFKSELQETKSELQETKSELQETKTELQETKTELQETKTELQDTQIVLKETKTELRELKRKGPKRGSCWDFDTSMADKTSLIKPTKLKLAKHYGFLASNAKRQAINDSQFCMFKYLNRNHECGHCFVIKQKKTKKSKNDENDDSNDSNDNKENKENKENEENEKNKENKGDLIHNMHLIPIGVVDVFDFYEQFETPKNEKKKYRREFNAESCDCSLLVCGEIKDLFDLGAIAILPSDPLGQNRYPLTIIATGQMKRTESTKNISTAYINQLVSKYKNGKLGWPNGDKSRPYVRTLVQHATHWCVHCPDTEAYIELSQAMTESNQASLNDE